MSLKFDSYWVVIVDGPQFQPGAGPYAGLMEDQTQPVGLGRPPHLQMSFIGPFLNMS